MKFLLSSFLALLATIAATQSSTKEGAADSRPLPQTAHSTLRLETTTFEFPGSGKRNNNATIGDFCCTGETAAVRTAQGTPVGFIYFYDFSGGINLKPGSAADQFGVLVSGVSDPERLTAGRISREKSSIKFSASEMKPGLTRQTIAGALQFTVTIRDVEFIDEAHTRFWMDSIKVGVDVQVVPVTQSVEPLPGASTSGSR